MVQFVVVFTHLKRRCTIFNNLRDFLGVLFHEVADPMTQNHCVSRKNHAQPLFGVNDFVDLVRCLDKTVNSAPGHIRI